MNRQRLEAAIETGKSGKITYPEFLNAIRDAGVRSYEVDVATGMIAYRGGNADDVYEETKWSAGEQLEVSDEFNTGLVKSAVLRNQRKETDYATFLKEIARAGVLSYKVDVSIRTIKYEGRSQSYTEQVPDPDIIARDC
ncbi:MAG: DUF1398 family protein [Rhabdochlamydiaceae bacterium]